MSISLAYDDPRPIDSIFYDGENAGGHWVGAHGCTKIQAYSEPGHMANILFYAVYRGEEIFARVPGTMVTVQYKVDK